MKLLEIYWLVLISFYCPLSVMFNGEISLAGMIKNICLININYLHSAWYVSFYIKAMISLAILHLIHSKKMLEDILGALFIMIFVFSDDLFLHYFPVVVTGYFFAKYNVYEKVYLKINNPPKYLICNFLLLGGAFILRIKYGDMLWMISTITFMAPPLICILNYMMYFLLQCRVLRSSLGFICKYCTFFWLMHSVFHSGMEQVQWFAYLPKYSFAILIWVIIIMIPFDIIQNNILFFIRKLRRKLCQKEN